MPLLSKTCTATTTDYSYINPFSTRRLCPPGVGTAISMWPAPLAASVVKYEGQGQSGQARYAKSNCFRRLEKLVLPSIFDKFFIFDDVKYPTTVSSERMWHFMGSKHTLTPPINFQGVKTRLTPRIYNPVCAVFLCVCQRVCVYVRTLNSTACK